ncbi:transmembrane 4 L6 family member 19 [Alligator mississippiensis]|uniref:Transmembrane 4 L6 family member 19 isoform X2 n=1 Tax=Alligator sinensis TaxID=38654 RepID=A0A1U7SNC7_ALLSI|nr:transmembrane 4 L6 family member 19 isoform X2 [Alligator sinensis]XP_006267090.1 transmembrane 4 L6 family member 19 [Alligator mississippiensis]XP_025072757.1 transmembrane 4 L6 family member 19 isoform X2 [Alligator sinensis]XP_025072758.1 transmembrane 4 L6 family member 19 isoform X2 [Alligator sinensis]
MCVGKCTRILGPCLLVLGMLSIAVNIFLLFPNWSWKYLQEGHITKQAMQAPGIWGGGMIVLLAATHITAVGWRCGCFSDCGTWRNLFLSIILSGLALLGSAACFIMAGLGLTNGPLCLSNGSTHNQDGIQHWNYPFSDTSSQDFTSRADNYLFNQSLWTSVCIEPPRIVPWNISLFSLLMIISAVEMVLASLQIINGFFGCLCGFCEGK